ncbi:MAG: hypothetical protein Q9182_001263 [Xanthomendoza sp. 2 TL-2023]
MSEKLIFLQAQTNTLTTALQALYAVLLPVIEDAKRSQAHRSASYETFMKDADQAQFVAEVITNVTVGNAMYAAHPPYSNGNPTLVCAKHGMFNLIMPDGSKRDALERCLESNLAASYLYPTPFIMLCPVVFQLRASPPNDGCPSMNRRTNHYFRKKVDDDRAGSSITLTHTTLLLHEIVHYYLYAQPEYVALKPEALNINAAWKLTAEQALRNAENYVYYVYTTAANCTEWPTLGGEDGRGELLDTTDTLNGHGELGTPTEEVLAVKDVSIDLPETAR